MARYHVILESPLGERSGTLTLYERGGTVTGMLSLLGTDNLIEGSREGMEMSLRHTLKTCISALECHTQLHETSGGLQGTVCIGVVRMPLQGQKIEEATEKEHQAHGTADQA